MYELLRISLHVLLVEEVGVERRADESESDRPEDRSVSDNVARSVLRSVDCSRKSARGACDWTRGDVPFDEISAKRFPIPICSATKEKSISRTKGNRENGVPIPTPRFVCPIKFPPSQATTEGSPPYAPDAATIHPKYFAGEGAFVWKESISECRESTRRVRSD